MNSVLISAKMRKRSVPELAIEGMTDRNVKTLLAKANRIVDKAVKKAEKINSKDEYETLVSETQIAVRKVFEDMRDKVDSTDFAVCLSTIDERFYEELLELNPESAVEGFIKDKLAEVRMNPMEKRLTADFNLVKKSYNAFKKPLSFASEKIVHEDDKNHDVKTVGKAAGNLAAMFVVTKGACSVIKSNANKIYGTIKDIGVIGALVGGGVNKAADALTGISKATGLSETMVVYLTAVGITIGKKQIDVMTKRTNLNKYSADYNRSLKKVTTIYENVEKTYKAIMDDKDVSSGDEKKRAKEIDKEKHVDRKETPEKAEFREDKAFGEMCRHFVEVINTELKKVNSNLESLLSECTKLSKEEKEEKSEEVAKIKSGEDEGKKENWRAPKNPEERAKWIHERRERKREKEEMQHAIKEKEGTKESYIWSMFEDCYAAFEAYYFDTEDVEAEEEPAMCGLFDTVKALKDNHDHGKLADKWNSTFKELTALLEDIVEFKKAVKDPNTSEAERERCKKLLAEKEKRAGVLRGEERSLRAKIDAACADIEGRKPLIDAVRLSLTKELYDEFVGGATEGFIEKLEEALDKAGDYADEFFKTTGVQVAQIVDGSRDKAIELYGRRVKELTHASRNLDSVNQSELFLKIPPLKADGTVDTEVLDLKEKGRNEELSKAELKHLIAKGIAYYTTMLKNTKDIDSNEVMGTFNQMMRDMRSALNIQ